MLLVNRAWMLRWLTTVCATSGLVLAVVAEDRSALKPSDYQGEAPAKAAPGESDSRPMPKTASDAASRLILSEEPARQARPTAPPDAASPSDGTAGHLSPEMLALRTKVRRVLSNYQENWILNTRDHNAWEIMHAVVAYGVNTQVRVGGPEGEKQHGIGLLCFNRPFRGPNILALENGKPIATKGVGVQGHKGQLLAILAQGALQRDYPLQVGGQSFTLEDLIESEKLSCRAGEELSFKLIAFSHYLPTDATWKSSDGQEWSISRLIKEEIAQPILYTAPCGGTHRLMGLTYAYRTREMQGKAVTGEFARAQKYIADYRKYAQRLQNSDGSFSTRWFERREAQPDLNRRVKTSGHILEWLAYATPENELQDAWVAKAVDYLATVLDNGKPEQWEIGPLGHALHALAIYNRRVFVEAEKKAQPATVADTDSAAATRDALR